MPEEQKLFVGPALAEIMRVYRDNAGVLLSLAVMIFVPLTLLTEIAGRDNVTAGMIVSLAFSGPAAFIYGGLVAPIALARVGGGGRGAGAGVPGAPGADGMRGEPGALGGGPGGLESPGAFGGEPGSPGPLGGDPGRLGVPGGSGGGDPESIGDLWRGASPAFGHLLIAGLIYTIATTLGVFALLVPSLIMITIWAAAPAVIRLEDARPLQSLARSRELVRGNGWRVFGLVIAILVLILGLSIVLGALAVAIAGQNTGSFIGSWLGVVLSAPLLGLMPTVLYRRLHRPVSDPDPTQRLPGR